MEIKPFYSGRAYYDITADDGEKYVFVPQEFVEKGFVQGGQQFYSPGFLTPDALSAASAFTLPSDSSLTDAAKSIYKEPTKGLVWKADDFNKINYDNFSIKAYEPNDGYGTIKGYAIKDGVPYYAQATTPGSDYTLLDKSGTSTSTKITYTVTGGGGGGGFFADLGREILKAGPILPAALDIVGAAYGLPGIGTAIGLGTAGGLAATGRPEAALNYGAAALIGQLGVGSSVAGATGSNLAGQVASGTTAGLLTGKTPEEALKAGVVGAGAGLAGRTVAGATDSAVAGQVAAGTTAGLLTGKTAEQSLAQGVSNIKLDSLIPGSVATVPTEQQVLVGQQDLMNQLAPFQVDTTASSFDTKDIIDDGSGFTPPTPLPQTPITGSTGGNIMDEDYEGASMSAGLSEYLADPEGAAMYADLQRELNADPEGASMSAGLSQAVQNYATGTGLKIGDVVKLFKSNPSLTKGLITAGISTAGGLLTNQANVEAARISAQAMRDAAATAAEAQKFRPVGVTTRFGASQFGFDPTTGQLTSAGYQLTPELKAMQDRIMALSGQGLTEAEQAAGRYAPLTAGAQGLFGLGQQYLAQSPEQVAADYMARQQNLLAPSRERQLAQLQNQLFNTGRGGLSVGATGMRPSGAAGLGAASPEMEAYYNALAQQDAALAAQATQAGQQQVQFGAGLLGSGANLLGSYTQGLTGAYSPFSTGVGVGSSLESLGQAPLDIGAQLGGRSAQAGANVGQTLLQGGLLGARTTQAASGVSPFGTALTGLANSPEAQQALAQWLSSSDKRTQA